MCYPNGMNDETKTAKPPRRRGRKPNSNINRSSILDAAIMLALENGPEALSTVRIARAMDIVQSGFYAHFKNMDDCISALALRIEASVRAPIAERMAALRQSNPSDAATLTPYYEGLFDLIEDTGPLMELFLRYRQDRSPLGAVLDQGEAALVEDLTDHLDAIMPADAGAPALAHRSAKDRRQACFVMAHFLVRQTFEGVRMWREGQLARTAAARLLAEQTAVFGVSAAAAGMFARQVDQA